jgi:hypothetical protein
MAPYDCDYGTATATNLYSYCKYDYGTATYNNCEYQPTTYGLTDDAIAYHSSKLKNYLTDKIYLNKCFISNSIDGTSSDKYSVYKKYQYIDATTCSDNWVVYNPCCINLPPLSPGERLKQILQSRQGPLIIGTRKAIAPSAPERELRARETLQRVVGELQYRKFLKHGFITVRAKSGLVYQLFHNSTYAWRDGKRVEHLCVVLRGDFPPTDTLIVRYLMILNNEEQFRATANRSQACHSGNPFDAGQRQDLRSLVEIFRELKLAA